MNGDLSIAGRSTLAEYVADATMAIHFQLVRNADQIGDEDNAFRPEMAHQIFGDNESIFGYRNLRIDLMMSCGALKAFLDVKYDSKIRPEENDGVGPDPVLPPITKLLAPEQLASNLEDFKTHLTQEEQKFKPIGEKVHEFSPTRDSAKHRKFEIFFCDTSMPGFTQYHARLQPWIIFYIDAASYIDIDDEHWRFFLLFEKFEENGETRYAVAGYSTVYQYYAYPANIRPRISQMLVLPPFRKLGLGAELLQTVQRHYWENAKVKDITVEDPSEDFIKLRDFVDCRNCMTLQSFQKDSIKRGFTQTMLREANDAFKLCRKQIRRVYEILRLQSTNRNSVEDYKLYRSDVENRLNMPFQKEERQLEKLRKVLKPEEFAAATINMTNQDQRMETINAQYQELEEHYLRIIDRLAA